MPRAAPDPLIENFQRSKGKQLTYTLRAFRSGHWEAYLGDVLVLNGNAAIAGFGSNNYPSNRKQAQAMALAKRMIENQASADW